MDKIKKHKFPKIKGFHQESDSKTSLTNRSITSKLNKYSCYKPD
jgi:hypothetical protein